MTVSRKLELAGQDDEAAVVREAVTVSFGVEGLPLDQLPDTMRAVAAEAPAGSGRSSRSAAAHPGRPAIATELRSSWLRASQRNDAVPSGPGHPFHAQVDVGASRLSG